MIFNFLIILILNLALHPKTCWLKSHVNIKMFISVKIIFNLQLIKQLEVLINELFAISLKFTTC